MREINNYKEPQTMKFQNAVARIFRPELTEAERAERIKEIHNAAADLTRQIQMQAGMPRTKEPQIWQ